MSIITICVGQCGNQVGFEFLKVLKNEKDKDSIPFNWGTFFHSPIIAEGKNGYKKLTKAKFILVDTEPKVVKEIKKKKKFASLIKKENMITTSDGCGNNWGLGYHNDKIKKKGIIKDVMFSLEKEIKNCESIKAILLFHSLSGGTGSGLGSRIIEEIKQKYQQIILLSVCISPFSDGDTNLKLYNSISALAWLQKYADAILCFHNDDLIKRFKKMDLEAMNIFIATTIFQLFSPRKVVKEISNASKQRTYKTNKTTTGKKQRKSAQKGKWKSFDVFSFITKMIPHENCKFLSIQTSTVLEKKDRLRNCSWNYTFQLFKKFFVHYDMNNKKIESISQQVILRGKIQPKIELNKIKEKIIRLLNIVDWRFNNMDDSYDGLFEESKFMSLPSKNIDNSITIVSNNSFIVEYLNKLLCSVQMMLQENAYLHWYERYDVKKKHFEECIDILHKVIVQYANFLIPE